MTEPPPNPYESPSLAASNEAARRSIVLAESERLLVDAFLGINRMITAVIIGFGVVILLGSGILLTNAVPMPKWPVPFIVPILVAVVVIGWGILQGRKNLVAILATAGVSLALFVTISASTLFTPRDASLIGLLVVIGLIFLPPVWVAIMAIGWVRRGIQLRDLPDARFERQDPK